MMSLGLGRLKVERKFHLVYGDGAFAKPGGKPGMYGCEVGFAGSRGRGRK